MNKPTIEQLAQHIITFYDEYDLRVAGKINNQNAFQLIETIENKFDTDSIMLFDGTRIWNLLRVFLYSNFQKLSQQTTQNKRRTFPVKAIASLIQESVIPLQLPKHMPICGFSSGESRKLYNDTYYDIYLDPLYDILDDRLTVFEWPETTGARRKYDRQVYSRQYVPMHIPMYTKTFWNLLLYQLTGRRHYVIQSDQTLQDILKFVSTNASIDEAALRKNVYDFITVFMFIKQFLFDVLKRVHAQAVLIRCGYGRFPMALSQACHELQIPSIELQHGLITAYLPAYRRTTETHNRDCVPEYLLAQGDVYTRLVQDGHLFDKNKVFSVGYPYLEKKLAEKKENQILKTSFTRFPRNLLITSQWVVATEIQQFVLSVADQLEQQLPDIGILFKPHPFDRNEYTELQTPKNIILVDKYEDTFKLFAIADIHATVYSTSGLEAMAFAVPNIFIDIYHLTPITGTPYIVSTPDQFVAAVQTILTSYEESSKETKAIADLFFTSNSETHFAEFFKSQNLL